MSLRRLVRSVVPLSLAALVGCAGAPPVAPAAPRLEVVEFDLQDDGLHLVVTSSGRGEIRWTLESEGEVVVEAKGHSFGDRHGATLPITDAGDFELVAEVDGVKVRVDSIMSRVVQCAAGRKKRVVERVSPPTLHLGDVARLDVPRWVGLERDASFIVEWRHEGRTLFHTTARDTKFESASDIAEEIQTPDDAFFRDVCAFRFGETYDGPSFAEITAHPGEWEVVVHREGVASLAGSFVLSASAKRGTSTPIALTRVDTPSTVTIALGDVPSTCWHVCPEASSQVAVPVGEHDPRLDRNERCLAPSKVMHPPHTVRGGDLATVQFGVEEFRADMRGRTTLEARVAIHDIRRNGRTNVEYPFWEYDDDLSPSTNWDARWRYEKQSDVAFAQEDRVRAAMAAKLVPAFMKLVHEKGGPFTADEIPAPPAGSDL